MTNEKRGVVKHKTWSKTYKLLSNSFLYRTTYISREVLITTTASRTLREQKISWKVSDRHQLLSTFWNKHFDNILFEIFFDSHIEWAILNYADFTKLDLLKIEYLDKLQNWVKFTQILTFIWNLCFVQIRFRWSLSDFERVCKIWLSNRAQ